MSDWKYELDDGLIAFYEDGIQRSVDKVFDALNTAEKRIAELEAENERLQDAWFVNETICPDGSLRPKVSTLLNRIAELEAEIAALKERQRWIPVSERLPEEGREVLVVFNDGCVVGCHLTNQKYLDDNLEFVEGNIWRLGGVEGIAFWAGEGYEDVTHWMPLPELPAEAQE